jgi:hypothetical protein
LVAAKACSLPWFWSPAPLSRPVFIQPSRCRGRSIMLVHCISSFELRVAMSTLHFPFVFLHTLVHRPTGLSRAIRPFVAALSPEPLFLSPSFNTVRFMHSCHGYLVVQPIPPDHSGRPCPNCSSLLFATSNFARFPEPLGASVPQPLPQSFVGPLGDPVIVFRIIR